MATFYIKTNTGLTKVGGDNHLTIEQIVTALGYIPANSNILDKYKDTLDSIEYKNGVFTFKDASSNVLATLDASGNLTVEGTIQADSITADTFNGLASLATALTTNGGSASRPVYFSGGKPVECGFEVNKTVPSNAEFTDSKVTNTLNTSSKYYVTGTTSTSTNTGTQIFDTGVYVDTTAGKLVAGSFSGPLTGNVTGNVVGNVTGNATSADKVNKTLTINAGGTNTVSFDGSSDQTLIITPTDLGLTSAMLYIGKSTTAITNGGAETPTIGGSSVTPANGNVVIYGTKEFIWNGSAWDLFGDEGSYKVKQTAVPSPTANGTSKAFIDSISQDANGVITVTKKTFDETTLNAATLTAGLVKTDKVQYTNKLEVVNSSGTTIATFDGSGVTASKFTGDVDGNITGNAAYASNAGALNGKLDSSFATSKHIHEFNGVAVASNNKNTVSVAAQEHTHTTVTDGVHNHKVTATGAVALSGSLSDGVLTISATFVGNEVETTSHNGHTHGVNTTTTATKIVSSSEHNHDVIGKTGQPTTDGSSNDPEYGGDI